MPRYEFSVPRLTDKEKQEINDKEKQAHLEAIHKKQHELIQSCTKWSNVPSRYKYASLTAINELQAGIIKQIRENINGKSMHEVKDMLLIGSVGTGKTHLAIAMVNALAGAGIHAKYITEYQLFELYFKKEYGKFDSFKESKMLVIDEIGKRELAEWQKIHFEELVSYRYSEMLPTVFITNLTKDEFKAFIGDRLADRLKDNSVIVISAAGESLRGMK